MFEERARFATRGGSAPPVGGATWFRQAAWFNNRNGYRPDGHVALPFSTKTIERGLANLTEGPLISAQWSNRHPDTGHRLANRRKIGCDRPGRREGSGRAGSRGS